MALGNKTLEDLVKPISKKLGRIDAPYEVPAPEYRANPARPTDGLSQDELVELFAAEAAKVRVNVRRCRKAGVAGTIADIIASDGGGDVVISADLRITGLQVAPALENDSSVGTLTVWDAAKADECIAAANAARFGISYASAGIAETGTVLQVSDARCGRSVSLLPLVHIAIVDASSIKATMADVMRPYETGELALPAQLCFISGPSATSDIELVRVEGVHGPMYVHYVVVG